MSMHLDNGKAGAVDDSVLRSSLDEEFEVRMPRNDVITVAFFSTYIQMTLLNPVIVRIALTAAQKIIFYSLSLVMLLFLGVEHFYIFLASACIKKQLRFP